MRAFNFYEKTAFTQQQKRAYVCFTQELEITHYNIELKTKIINALATEIT